MMLHVLIIFDILTEHRFCAFRDYGAVTVGIIYFSIQTTLIAVMDFDLGMPDTKTHYMWRMCQHVRFMHSTYRTYR